jgi:CRISPR type IV-associated protein Csf3
MMQPLQITAYVAGSIALARPEDLALDGILAYQVLRKHFGADFYTLPDPKERLLFARLPLEMRGETVATETGDLFPAERIWYWACSSAQIEVKGRGTQYWNKRFDTQPALSDHLNFDGKVEKIIIEAGRYKAYHMPLPTLVCDRVTWYAYGYAEEIADLLCDVASLGKKRNYGNGACLRWEIVSTMEDYSTWKDNKLMRPIPGPLVKGMTPLDIQYIAYRAPQWHSANQAMCATKAVRDDG